MGFFPFVPLSGPPSGAAGGGLIGTYPNPGLSLTASGLQSLLGSGSDGALVFDGIATPVGGATLAGSTYTMTRDILATAITVNNGITIKTANFRIFCQGTLTNNGTITNTGQPGAAGNGGVNASSQTLTAGRNGGNGGTGVSGAGVAGTSAAFGATSGAGGAGTSGAAGGSAAPSITTFANLSAGPLVTPTPLLDGVTLAFGTASASPSNCGSSGGGGGSDASSNAGGGGGAGGGVVAIFAGAVNNGGGTISAQGGAGAAGTGGNAGGGGGGAGGLIVAYTLSAWTAGTTNVTGGALGAGVGTGSPGVVGGNGLVLNVVI